MIVLLIGLFVWAGAHLFPALAPATRARVIARSGMGVYKLVFALLIFGSVALMVIGWRLAEVHWLYAPPSWGRSLALVLMPIALLLMLASSLKSNIRRWLPHPQLLGFALWALLHLLASGSVAAVVLFTGLGLWALLEIVVLSRRVSIKAQMQVEATPITRDLAAVALALMVYTLLVWAHAYFAGVALIGG